MGERGRQGWSEEESIYFLFPGRQSAIKDALTAKEVQMEWILIQQQRRRREIGEKDTWNKWGEAI